MNLGHGVHQVLAAGQGELLSSTPLTLAETASVFGEMLTFRKLLDAAKTPAERKTLLAGKVEDMINTVVRQIAFYDFECKLHAARAEGELTPDDINALWMSRSGAKPWAMLSNLRTDMRRSGPISRISCTRRSTSMPMLLATVW